MFHFLARLGKQPWTRSATVTLAIAAAGIHGCMHIYGHKIIRNLLVAQNEDGPASISDELESLIMTVSEDIKDQFNQPILPFEVEAKYALPDPPIKWFASSLLMPITFGLTSSRGGLLIGLPSYYNYSRVEDLPDSMFQVMRIKLIKDKAQTEADKETSQLESDGLIKKGDTSVVRLKKSDPDVVEYANTLILSEKAKKFAIARELFMGDTIRPLVTTSLILVSSLLSIFVSRSAVMLMKLADAHVTYRLPVYGIAGLGGILNFNAVSDTTNRKYILDVDKKAASVNADYKEGAREFLTKTIQRHKALRNLLDDYKSIYDQDGNLIQPFIRFKHVPFEDRLKLIEREVEV